MIFLGRTAGCTCCGAATLALAVAGCLGTPSGFAGAPSAQLTADRFADAVTMTSTTHRLYIANTNTSTITTYRRSAFGDARPVAAIAGSATGLATPYGLAVSGTGTLYVANFGGSVTEYNATASGNAPPIATISGSNTNLSGPTGLAIDPAGRIYVSNFVDNFVSVFGAGANGDVAPVATISGSKTRIFGPWGIAVHGKFIYVAQYSGGVGGEIDGYRLRVNGNVAPSFSIAGGQTRIDGPRQISFDSAGRLYVAGNGQILVFAAGAEGNVAPIQVLAGGLTGFNDPEGVSVSSSLMFVADSGTNAIDVFSQSATGGPALLRTITESQTLLSDPTFIIAR